MGAMVGPASAPVPRVAAVTALPAALLLRFHEVPAYETRELLPRRTRYCIAPIVYNEGERFCRQIERMAERAALADIIVAERRSSDGSTAPELLRSHGVRALLTTDEPGGAAAIRMALAYALAQGYEGVILMDGHGKDGVEALPEYIRQLDAGADFVQGSRFMKGGVHKNTPLARTLGIRLVMSPLLFLSGRFWYTDSTNGFRGYSRRYLTHPRVEPLRACFKNFNLQFFLSYMAPKLKLKVVEIPVSRVYPDDKTVPTKVIGFRRNFMVFWEMVLTVLGKYDPPS
jgi:dolichol-phosphate mannosyltransferase